MTIKKFSFSRLTTAWVLVTIPIVLGTEPIPPPKIEWAPLSHHVQVYPEISIGGQIYTDVSVTYFTTKQNNQPLNHDLWHCIEADKSAHSVNLNDKPMADRLGYLLLSFPALEDLFVVFIEEESNIVIMKAGTKTSTPAVYQPFYGKGRQVWCFHSPRVAKALLSLPGVAISDDERFPWRSRKKVLVPGKNK